jgi:hypothetical protein
MTLATKPPHYTVYRTTDLTNGKVYVGKHKTDNPNDGYLGSGKLLRRAIEKHGRDSFRKEVLHVFPTEEEMDAKEAELVTEEFCLRDDNYNLCSGGKGGWSYVNSFVTSEQKSASGRKGARMSSRSTQRFKEARYEAAIKPGFYVPSFKDRRHTDDTKRKIAIANARMIGSKNSQFGTIWITDGSRNSKINGTDVVPDGWRKGRIRKVS